MRPKIGVIDAHHHIWRMGDVPWLMGEARPRIFGSYDAIRRDYLISEFKRDSSVFNVTGSIYVQANWAPSRALEEARWVDSVADGHGLPHGIIAFADLRSTFLSDLIDEYRSISRVVGVRHQIHWHKNSNYAYVPIPDMYDQADWRHGLRILSERGYPFDLQVFPSQLRGAARLIREFPSTTFILNHAGMLDSTERDYVAMWEDGLNEIALNPNAFCKLTGLGTFARSSSAALYRPIVATALRLFGARRCIFGSNFPVEGMWVSYGDFCEHMLEALGPITEAERSAIFREAAMAAYSIRLPD